MGYRHSVASFSFLILSLLLVGALPLRAQTVEIVHSFTREEPAEGPWPPWAPNELVKGDGDRLYGVTRFGGGDCPGGYGFTYWSSCGVAFELTSEGGFRVIYDFEYAWRAQQVRLTWPGTGVLYMVESGDAYSPGSLKNLTPAADGPWQMSVVRSFGQNRWEPSDPTTCQGVWRDGEKPFGPVLLAPDGRFYGATSMGGNGGSGCYLDGTAYRLWPDGSGYERLHSFTGQADYSGNPGTGRSPYGPLLEAGDGHIYGTTSTGGDPYYDNWGYGTIFRVRYDTLEVERVHSFRYATGGSPRAGLLRGPDGEIYGTTTSSPGYTAGTLFRMTVTPEAGATATVVNLHTFTGDEGGPVAMVSAPDGFLYGTTLGPYGEPDADNLGLVFRIRPDGTGYEVLHTFTGPNGARPAALVFGSDMNLYGAASEGGPGGGGVVFRVNLAPTVEIRGPYVTTEGAEVTLEAAGTDPQGGTPTFAWDLDGDADFDDASGATALFAADNGTYDVSVRVTAPTGLTATATTTVTVTNVEPTVSIEPATLTLVPGQIGSFTVSFADPGPDTWTMELDYDDGSTDTVSPASPGAVTLTHTWTRPGTFALAVRVWDDDGASGSATATVEVGPPADSVRWLIEAVDGLVDIGTLNKGQGHSLIVKLEEALEALERGDTKKAIGMLEPFIHEVRAFWNAGILGEEQAKLLIGIAERVIASLSD